MDLLNYSKKQVVVVGCFSGMGEATARLLAEIGAEVHGLDFRETDLKLASFRKVDLRDPASMADAVTHIDGKIDALFNCAGLPHTAPPMDVMKVNFLGTRTLTEALLPKLSDGGAIASISSTAGLGWSGRLDTIRELVATASFDEGVKWCEAHMDQVVEGYRLSKEALTLWTMLESTRLIRAHGIRMNCTWPGPTQTPMMNEFEKATPGASNTFPMDRCATPEEQALPLIFLNSHMATHINGVALPVDGGFMGAFSSGQPIPQLIPDQ